MHYEYRNPVYIKPNIVNLEIKLNGSWVPCTVNMTNPGDLKDLRDILKQVHIPEEFKEETGEFTVKYKNRRYSFENWELMQSIALTFPEDQSINWMDYLGEKHQLKVSDIKEILKLYASNNLKILQLL